MRIAGYLCSLLYKQFNVFLHVNFFHIFCFFNSVCNTEIVLKSLYLQLRNSTVMEPRHLLLCSHKLAVNTVLNQCRKSTLSHPLCKN